jgi:acyl-coenzyme A synthetase/AMP-(fatty) acid ligase
MGEPGLLAVSRRDPGLMLGYWRDPEGSEQACRGEWFITGDRVVMDEDFSVTHLGRADETMNALGYRVSPSEVELALAGHPSIAEVAVAELPVRPDLSVVAAFVVPRGDWPGDEVLEAHAARQLARYKQPRAWIQVDRLPRSPNGKLRRRILVDNHRRDVEAAAPSGRQEA